MIMESFASLPPSRTIDALRHWFRERHATRDRRLRRPADPDGFAVTEWAETQSAVGALDDPLAPPPPMRVMSVPQPLR